MRGRGSGGSPLSNAVVASTTGYRARTAPPGGGWVQVVMHGGAPRTAATLRAGRRSAFPSQRLPGPRRHSLLPPLPFSCGCAYPPLHEALCARLDRVPLCAPTREGAAPRPAPLHLHRHRLPLHAPGEERGGMRFVRPCHGGSCTLPGVHSPTLQTARRWPTTAGIPAWPSCSAEAAP